MTEKISIALNYDQIKILFVHSLLECHHWSGLGGTYQTPGETSDSKTLQKAKSGGLFQGSLLRGLVNLASLLASSLASARLGHVSISLIHLC